MTRATARPAPPAAPKGPLSLADACRLYEAWGERTGELSAATRETYRGAAAWAMRVAGELVDPLPRGPLVLARDELLANVSAATARRVMTSWRRAWGWCHERELVVQPWPVQVKRPRARPTAKGPFSEGELADLLAWARTRPHGALVHLCLWSLAETAGRNGEVLRLRVRDLERAPDGSWTLRLHQTKQGRSRLAAISPALGEALRARAGGRPAGELLLRWEPGESTVGGGLAPHEVGRALKPRWLAAVVARWTKARGLEGLRDVHSIRRTAVARLASAGVHVEVAARLLDHASLDVHRGYLRNAPLPGGGAASRLLWVAAPGGGGAPHGGSEGATGAGLAAAAPVGGV